MMIIIIIEINRFRSLNGLFGQKKDILSLVWLFQKNWGCCCDRFHLDSVMRMVLYTKTQTWVLYLFYVLITLPSQGSVSRHLWAKQSVSLVPALLLLLFVTCVLMQHLCR